VANVLGKGIEDAFELKIKKFFFYLKYANERSEYERTVKKIMDQTKNYEV
jgi:hypothetical protein